MIRYRRSGHSTGTTPIPHGRFVRGLDRSTIAEVQRAPDSSRDQAVGEPRLPSRTVSSLRGEANLLTLPCGLREPRWAHGGRHPAAARTGRNSRRRPTFLRKAFAGTLATPPEELIGHDLVRAVLDQGVPGDAPQDGGGAHGLRLREGAHMEDAPFVTSPRTSNWLSSRCLGGRLAIRPADELHPVRTVSTPFPLATGCLGRPCCASGDDAAT